MSSKSEKTNVMRLLDQKKIPYEHREFEEFASTNGEEIAAYLGEDPAQVFKTLVAVGKSAQHYVFIIPVNSELNLKKAAKACGEKSVEMIKQKELLTLTGYVHGGCSPIGMKKLFPTFADVSANDFDEIFVSAGKIGHQVKLPVQGLCKMLPVSFCELKEAPVI